MPEEFEELKDWRGTPINIGDTVIYASPKGRSCSFVEGIVKSFSPTNVVVYVVRESFGGSSRTNPTVNVRPDRVTVVNGLPASTTKTVLELKIDRAKKLRDMYAEDLEAMKQGIVTDRTKNMGNYYTLDYVTRRVDEYDRDLNKLVQEQTDILLSEPR